VSRLQACFARLQAEDRKALIPYIMTGDPHPDVTVPLMHAMVKAGANIIELGAPFSDPMADGPVIQAAAERALEFHITLDDVFKAVREFRKLDDVTPIIMMGYLNLIEVAGYVSFARNASAAGIDGVITVDMPPEEAQDYISALEGENLDPVFLIAPTSTDERIGKIGAVASGFVYYVSLKGVTGAANLDVDSVRQDVNVLGYSSGFSVFAFDVLEIRDRYNRTGNGLRLSPFVIDFIDDALLAAFTLMDQRGYH